MAVELIVAPEAALDITEAYVWYETHRMGLGEEFLSAVEACVERVRRQPLIYALVHEEYRRALIRRFPYAIFFDHANARNSLRRVSHVTGP